jgi:hypothetical protein
VKPVRTRRAVLRALFALPLAALVKPCAAQGEAEHTLEQRVKAAFLYRFTEFVTWPDAAFARPDTPFVMAVVGPGSEDIGENLRAITAKHEIAGRPIEVKRVGAAEPIPAAQVLYVAGNDLNRLREIVRNAPRYALIVSEAESALEHGSVINFVVVQDRVRFDASLESAEKRGLRLSSRLLAVARTVRGTY